MKLEELLLLQRICSRVGRVITKDISYDERFPIETISLFSLKIFFEQDS